MCNAAVGRNPKYHSNPIPVLKEKMLKQLALAEHEGSVIGEYTCPNCQNQIRTLMPDPPKNKCEKPEMWKVMTTCYECGILYNLKKYGTGNIIIDLLPG